jgi:two-component system chemotaxis sensor kinase CheA
MNDPSIIHEFLAESRDNLDQLDRDLVALEQDASNHERLASVFRTIHTIKGTCGFLGFAKLEAVTHAGENLLARLRDGQMVLTPDITTVLLALVDAVREMLTGIESTGQEPPAEYSDLVAALTGLLESVRTTAAAPTPEAPTRANILTGASESSVRVDVGLLDKLMNLVGELVLSRNRMLQCLGRNTDPAFLNVAQRLNLITTELQQGVMKTRMQPIGNIWNKFPRVVRDLAVGCGKQVRIEMDGKETELDRTIIEAIKDPLTHLVRNAVDHGIEAPAVRLARGKPAEGRVLLRAFHEGGQVNIELTDDGSGIDVRRIAQKALDKGVLTQAQALHMTERELTHLIFLPGLSTAEKITHVSGRGVGMDVVKTNIEKIGGAVDVQSRPGQGTTVKIKIPLTLAIVPALIVTTRGDRYAIPRVSLLELLRLDERQAGPGIETISGAPVYRLRGSLLPLVYLDRLLGLAESPAGPEARAVTVVVLQADGRRFGLVVDGVHDTEEIVVKPLSRQLKGIPLFAGATVMGDGKVALILDVLGIAQSAGVVTAVRERTLPDKGTTADRGRDTRQGVVLLELGRDRQLAVPLSQVLRLEEISAAAVEKTARQEVVQYRGRILPLIRLSEVLDGGSSAAMEHRGALQVVVCSENGRSAGLVVDRIVDAVDVAVELQRRHPRPGIVGTAVIRQRVTDLLDVPELLKTAD